MHGRFPGVPMNKFLSIAAASALAASCTHQVDVRRETVVGAGAAASAVIRRQVAHDTCEAQYERDKQNYLAAAETAIAVGRTNPSGPAAPLDAFRAEVNAAYNTVVQQCKTHMHCLEAQNYDEARCYMAASDRKDAERRFADLSVELRIIQNQMTMFADAVINSPSVSVTTSVNNANKQKQGQKQKAEAEADAHNGHDIDQDVLAVCGDVNGLLDRRCRDRCERC